MPIVPIGRAGKLVRELEQSHKLAIKKGIARNQRYAQAKLKQQTPVDTGQTKAGWAVGRRGGHPAVYNDSPTVGILELGARPHPVSPAGIDALYEWVRRKVPEAATGAPMPDGRDRGIYGMAHAIAAKIEREGQEPTYFVKRSLPGVKKHLALSVERALKTEKPEGA